MIEKWMQFKVSAEHDEAFAQALTELAEASSQETGCLTYEAYRCSAGSFAVLESWTNEAAFEAHRQASHTMKFKDAASGLNVAKEALTLQSLKI